MNYDHDNNTATDKINLVELLRAAPYGFDVTLVNFPKGTDYVERNAMSLVALLNRENAKLTANGSTEKVSIIGPSMGGLVSRYALAYMEKNNIPHNTKLWVSFDSPHLGANIPVGAQENLYFYGYKGRQDQAKTKFDENFRSPAARQMLIEQLDYKHENAPYPTNLMPGGTVPSGCNNNTPFRQLFQTSLNSNGISGSNGYPQNLRKIALINGTTNGTKTNGEGQMFLELAYFKIIKYGQIFGTPLQTKVKGATIEDRFLGTSNSTTQTFAGMATYFTGWNNNFPVVVNGKTIRTNSNPRGSMDNVQGGTFNTQGIIKDQFNAELEKLKGKKSIEWRTYLPNHAFIPTVSSLAFKNPNFDWSTAINRNLVCDPANKEIYFDTYFAPSKNEEHVFVSAENANWLIKELQDIPQAPHFPIEAGLLTGASMICENTNNIYQFSDICKLPSAVTWSVTPNLQIVSSTDYSVTVSQITNGSGTITATFQNDQTVSKTIWVGSPSVDVALTTNPNSGFVSVNLIGANSTDIYNQGITSIVWEQLSSENGGYFSGGLNSYLAHGFGPNSEWSCESRVTVTNSCGSSTFDFSVVGTPPPPCETTYQLSPISKNDYVANIIIDPCIANNTFKTVTNAPDNDINSAKLYDVYGTEIRKYTTNDFYFNDVKKGIYILKVQVKQVMLTKKIIVN